MSDQNTKELIKKTSNSGNSQESKSEKQEEQIQKQGSSNFTDLKKRIISAALILTLLYMFIKGGPLYCSFLVFFLIVAIFNELIRISKYQDRNTEIRNYYLVSYFMFGVFVYLFYGIALFSKIQADALKHSTLIFVVKHHRLICFFAYLIACIMFLYNLSPNHKKYCFRSFAFTHILVLLFVLPSSLIVSNIYNGLYWFIVPVLLVVTNENGAFFLGRYFGKTQLSELSPKKTIEGFVTGLVLTLIVSFILTEVVINYFPTIVCPSTELTFALFSYSECDTSLFIRPINQSLFGFQLSNLHFHSFVLAAFSSFISPLGGFFASGFKRAIKIKDFSNLIPGHGGITDRMDCQILMGFFTYLWIYSFTAFDEESKIKFIIRLISKLSQADQFMVMEYLESTLDK